VVAVPSRARQRFEKALIVLLLAVYAWRFVLPIFAGPSAPRADDFQDYLYAAHQIAVGGNPYGDFLRNHVPWDWSLSSGYLYPPAFAVFLIPLTWVANDTAVRLWLILIQVFVLASFIVIYRVIGRPRRTELLALVAVTTTFFPLASSVWTGAMNTLLLLMLTAAWAFWQRRRDVLSGTLIGAAAVFKVFPVALLPYLAWRRHARLCAAAIVTGLAGLILGLLATGLDHNLYYVRDMLPHLSAGTGFRENQSLAGVAARICQPSTAVEGGSAGWCGRALTWPADLLLLALVFVATRRATRTRLEFALAVCALPLISSVSWSFHLVLLLFPIALLLRHAFSHASVSAVRRRVMLLAWGCFALAPVIHYGLIIDPLPSSPAFMAALGAVLTRLFDETYFLGTVIVFALLWVSVREVHRSERADARLGPVAADPRPNAGTLPSAA
jgi:hypothetical protein